MSKIKIYNLISIFAGFVLCLILIKGFGKNQQEQSDISSGVDNVTIILDGESLKIKLVAGMFWTVESSKPIRIRLKDGYLESMGDSITWGFEYGFSQRAIMVFPDSSESKEDTLIYPKAALEQFDFCIAERGAIDFYRKQGFKVVAEWSHTRQCSVMVQWSKTGGDSTISYSVSNPDNYSQGIKQIKP